MNASGKNQFYKIYIGKYLVGTLTAIILVNGNLFDEALCISILPSLKPTFSSVVAHILQFMT